MAYNPDTLEKIQEIRKKTGPKPLSLEEKFWRKVDKRGDDECWPWLGATRNGTSYGSIGHEGKHCIAYRVSFELHYRPIEKDEWVMKSCDTKTCVNPSHLYIGDRARWAEKWHKMEPSEIHIMKLDERRRERSRQQYRDNKEQRIDYISRYQLERKLKAIAYKGGVCKHCRSKAHPAALQFHHRDPSQKTMNITSKELSCPKKYPWDTIIVPELDKCDLICSNCHFMHHSNWTEEMIEDIEEKLNGVIR